MISSSLRSALSLFFLLLLGSTAIVSGPFLTAAKAVPQEADRDIAGLRKYESANTEDKRSAVKDRVVFFGDSITESWDLDHSFPGKNYINRGIGGQTTIEMLLRFRADVVNLNPKVVVILAGTNDVAENLGPTTPETIEGHLASMVDIAEAHRLRVVLCSILPVGMYPWRKRIQPVEKIRTLNSWIKGYAEGRGVVYVDYYSKMEDEKHAMKKELSDDGVHPNAAGYAVMRELAESAIEEALGEAANSEQ